MAREARTPPILLASCAAAFAALLGASPTAADAAPPRDPFGRVHPLDLEPLDQAVGDVGPLSTSLRSMKRDLRQPVSFEEVYRVPGHDDLLMRISGGLYAVFPRSVYVPVRHGLVPVVPYGTIFHIGEPNPLMMLTPDGLLPPLPRAAEAASPDRIVPRVESGVEVAVEAGPLLAERAGGLVEGSSARRSVRSRPAPRAAAEPAEAPASSRAALFDPGYRLERFSALLRRAVEAARGAEPQG